MIPNETDAQARLLFGFGLKMRDHMLNSFLKAHNLAEGVMATDLSPPQIHMLMSIKNRGDITISDLAEKLGVSPPSASTMVDRLVDKGALVRERSKSDRRVVVVRLSGEADTFITSVEKIMLSEFTKLVDKLGPELTAKWCDVVLSIQKVMVEDERND